ncbi:MAG: YlxR family protein [Chloroflexi bacterium]|nr:YlxR family protein [Chloroflexota bacterium]
MKTLKVNNSLGIQRQKHLPERTCVACRGSKGKRELIRLVSSPAGIEIDPKGKKPGRGVYLCACSVCWERGLKSNRIELGLRSKMSAENRRSLVDYGRSLPGKED